MEKLIKNQNGQWKIVEDLEKARTKVKLPFKHGSVINLKRAVTHPETGETHGYEVHEHTTDGEHIVHPNIPYQHLDSHMATGRLRMGSEKATKKHDLYHSARMHHGPTRQVMANGTVKHGTEQKLHPEGEPHTRAQKAATE